MKTKIRKIPKSYIESFLYYWEKSGILNNKNMKILAEKFFYLYCTKKNIKIESMADVMHFEKSYLLQLQLKNVWNGYVQYMQYNYASDELLSDLVSSLVIMKHPYRALYDKDRYTDYKIDQQNDKLVFIRRGGDIISTIPITYDWLLQIFLTDSNRFIRTVAKEYLDQLTNGSE